jgi:hypothetical protein
MGLGVAYMKAKGKNTGFWSENLLGKRPNWKATEIRCILEN